MDGRLLALVLAAVRLASADSNFKIIGDGLVSGQQLFVGTANTIYIVDKAQNNPTQIAGHPAWASSYDLTTNTATALNVKTNTFCAGGASLGDGRWINVGGNNEVGVGGQNGNYSYYPSYGDANGGAAIRLIKPCDDGSCAWEEDPTALGPVANWRWYPTVETLADGSAIILGGDQYGGFVNMASQNNPTYEFYPSRGEAQEMEFLKDTLPANLYPLTWLVPSGRLFIQANWAAMTFDPDTGLETAYPNITKAVRTYPASAATAMLPQNAANNWTAPVLFCGGADYQWQDWDANAADNAYFRNHPNSASCVKTTPDTDPTWTDDDDMLEARSMGQFIYLPDGRLWLGNGISQGVAGYDSQGIPYGTGPLYTPAIYDSTKPSGQKWTRKGLEAANLPRLYHSSAVLAADGAVVIAGSSPYADFQSNGSMISAGPKSAPVKAEWWTELRLEKFYPDFYSQTRPTPTNMPTSISYGGDAFQISISSTDLATVTNASDIRFTIVRSGFSTHAINFGQRFVELETTLESNGSGAILNVAPLPPNPNVLAPGPAMAFVLINGVPSTGAMVMIGSGNIETQPTADYPALPVTNFQPAADAAANRADQEELSSSATHLTLANAALVFAFLALFAGR